MRHVFVLATTGAVGVGLLAINLEHFPNAADASDLFGEPVALADSERADGVAGNGPIDFVEGSCRHLLAMIDPVGFG